MLVEGPYITRDISLKEACGPTLNQACMSLAHVSKGFSYGVPEIMPYLAQLKFSFSVYFAFLSELTHCINKRIKG